MDRLSSFPLSPPLLPLSQLVSILSMLRPLWAALYQSVHVAIKRLSAGMATTSYDLSLALRPLHFPVLHEVSLVGGCFLAGELGHWAVGPSGRRALGPSGPWALGPLRPCALAPLRPCALAPLTTFNE